MIRFPYRKEKSGLLGTVYRPVGEVFFITDKEILEFPYIDSGADITLVPKSLGELLGFKADENKIKEIHGVGGESIPVILEDIRIRIGRHEFPVKIAWALIEHVPPLLGRFGIFDKFKIIFNEDNKTITFEWKGED